MIPPTLSVVALGDIIDYAVSNGLDRGELCERAGVRPDELGDFDVRVPAERAADVASHVALSLREPALAVRLAERTRLERYRLMGFLSMTAPDARSAIEAVIRYSKLLTNAGEYVMTDERGQTKILWSRLGQPAYDTRISDERFLCEFMACARQCTGQNFAPERVSFHHALHGDEAPYRRFFGCPIAWNAGETSLAIDARRLDVVPSAANPELFAFLHEQAELALTIASDCSDPASRVRGALARLLPGGEPAMRDVARQIGMSERTLRRQLSDAGTSYSAVVDEVRAEGARRLLERYSVTETAGFLGFSDASAFSRAFKRWTGASPSAYRAERRT